MVSNKRVVSCRIFQCIDIAEEMLALFEGEYLKSFAYNLDVLCREYSYLLHHTTLLHWYLLKEKHFDMFQPLSLVH